MRVVLEIRSGAFAGKKIRLQAGELTRVGRTKRSELALPDDSFMSSIHFILECDEKACRIRDYGSSNGTLVNGEKVRTAVLRDGDQIVAGQTHFVVRIESSEVASAPPAAAAFAGEPPAAAAPEERLLAMLRGQFQPLYAILDAAREPDVLKLLVESKQEAEKKRQDREAQAGSAAQVEAEGDQKTEYSGPPHGQADEGEEAQYESLFEGPPKGQLAHFAPYLVRLPAKSPLLERLVAKGWGKSWGIYLTCDQPFKEVRKHFRHFMMVKLPDGKQVYFRFYDPRVLRVYLPTCLPEEFNQFFGPVNCYLTEDEEPQALLRFSNAGRGVGRKALSLSIAGEPAAGTALGTLAGKEGPLPAG